MTIDALSELNKAKRQKSQDFFGILRLSRVFWPGFDTLRTTIWAIMGLFMIHNFQV